ncbi:hypothetical protein CQW23_29729 [Capsicum baccatum]|uniref:Lipoxygenase domain-containing protein n=1 Tax=Capsicum baccatum TaxID=33114 RepID=A0A2G2VCH3_CAPBA|nr:hypothetical protein CQW23_29729 [Capsicum baccatum]
MHSMEMLKELFLSDGEPPLKFRMPDVIKDDRSTWRTDEEFGKEMLDRVNPIIITTTDRVATVPKSSQPYSLKLLIEDYPYAADGLEIWATIEAWFDDYCSFYYLVDDMIQDDSELQSLWKEVREKVHAINFGQYCYAGYLPNCPTISRRFMPEPCITEYAELESNPDLAYLKTITAQF